MTKKSGVNGKTVPQLARSLAAAKRQEQRDLRSSGEQLGLLDARPGEALRERKRLNALGGAR